MRYGFGLAALATAGLAGVPAAADVSAEDVWASAMAPFEALNAEIAAEPVREGDRLVVDDIEIRFGFDEGRGRAILTTNGVVLEETGEGTVRVQYPAETKSIARLEFDGAEGAPEAMVLTRELDGTAFEQVASGEPGDVTHAFRTDALEQVMRVEMPEAAGGADVRMTARITGSEGTFRVTEGDLLRIGGAFDYETIILDSVTETEMPGADGAPPVRATQETAQRMEGVAMTFETALPKGTLSLIRGGVLGTLDDKGHKIVGAAMANSDRLSGLIDEILDLERLTAGKLTLDIAPCRIDTLVRQSVEINHGYADRFGVLLAIEGRLPELEVAVDQMRAGQILSNYISNAVKFSAKGQTVTVAVESARGGVRVVVSDRGQGIPEKFHGAIFKKFSQTDASDTRKSGGSGLGLAISKELASQMGGRVGFVSHEGEGARFWVEFPLCETGVDVTGAFEHA